MYRSKLTIARDDAVAKINISDIITDTKTLEFVQTRESSTCIVYENSDIIYSNTSTSVYYPYENCYNVLDPPTWPSGRSTFNLKLGLGP